MAAEGDGSSGVPNSARAALMVALAEAVEALPASERAAFVLRYVKRKSVEEISRLLQVPRAEVYERCARALSSCRNTLGDRLEDLET